MTYVGIFREGNRENEDYSWLRDRNIDSILRGSLRISRTATTVTTSGSIT